MDGWLCWGRGGRYRRGLPELLGVFSGPHWAQGWAGSPIPRPFLELAFIASWLLALLMRSHLPAFGLLVFSPDISRAQAMYALWLSLWEWASAQQETGSLQWSEKKKKKGRWAGHRLASRDKAVW